MLGPCWIIQVVTWGDPSSGGDSSSVADQLKDVLQLFSTDLAFAALRADGQVVTWGDPLNGGDSQEVQAELQHVYLIHGTAAAFAALTDGGCVVWGDPQAGGSRPLKSNSKKSWWSIFTGFLTHETSANDLVKMTGSGTHEGFRFVMSLSETDFSWTPKEQSADFHHFSSICKELASKIFYRHFKTP